MAQFNNMQRPTNNQQGLSVQNMAQQNPGTMTNILGTFPNDPAYLKSMGFTPYNPKNDSMFSGLGGFMDDFFMNKDQTINKIPVMQPNQMDAANQQLQSGLGNINRYSSFDPIAQNTMQRFEEYTSPSIQERLQGMGVGNNPRRYQAVEQARRGMLSDLAGQEQTWNAQQQRLGMDQMRMGMEPQFANQVQEGQASPWQQMLPLIGIALKAYLGGGMGGGGDIMEMLKNLMPKQGNNSMFDTNQITQGFGKNQGSALNTFMPSQQQSLFGGGVPLPRQYNNF